MNKNELMHKVQVYANNTAITIRDSNADPRTKQLLKEITDETCNVLAAIIEELTK